MKTALVSVINDLSTDQRVDKVCGTLTGLSFRVVLIGRRKRDSLLLEDRSYKMHRMRLLFEKGPLFYAEFNIRLFVYLLTRRTDLLVSNDLDTLLPNYLIHRMKGVPLVYDSHELFTETPEVIHRKFVRNTWERIERWIFPKLKVAITVSESIADIFRQKYGVEVKVIRNVPKTQSFEKVKSRGILGLPEDKKIIILQGSGINIQRGAEELIEAMRLIPDVLLLIAGGGDVIEDLKVLAANSQNIRFIPRQKIEDLYQYTMNCDLGLTLDKDTNLNYRYSLPNKLFDYVHAGIPVLASPLVEIKKIVDQYNIGDTVLNHDPEHIAAKISEMLHDDERIKNWKKNLKIAASELCWEKEEKILHGIYKEYV